MYALLYDFRVLWKNEYRIRHKDASLIADAKLLFVLSFFIYPIGIVIYILFC